MLLKFYYEILMFIPYRMQLLNVKKNKTRMDEMEASDVLNVKIETYCNISIGAVN